MLAPARVPARLEQRVAEAQREDVLYRLLAQIMVDAEGAVLGEDLGDGIVDLAARLQVVTERLFEPDPYVRAREPRRFEPFDRRPEQRSEEHTSELQSLMRISYAVFCLQKKNARE